MTPLIANLMSASLSLLDGQSSSSSTGLLYVVVVVVVYRPAAALDGLEKGHS